MIPTGQNTKPSFTEGFFEVAAKQNRSRQPWRSSPPTRNSRAMPARARARTPRSTASRSSTTANIRRPRPTSPRSCARSRRPIRMSVVICSYPPDSVGMVRAVNEIGFKPKMIGGAMVGLQATAIKTQLGPLLNGWVNYETWVPSKQMLTPEVEAFLKEYQARAGRRRRRSARLLSRHLGLRLYRIARQGGRRRQEPRRQQDRRISCARTRSRPSWATIKFGKNGEWAESGMMQVQYHSIKSNDLDQFRGMDTQTIVASAKQANRQGDLSVREGEAVTAILTCKMRRRAIPARRRLSL